MKSRSLIISNNGSPPFDNSPKNRRNPRQRVRMSRCGKCIGCNSKNCGKCYKCLDMVKYGGPGTLKQACEKRQCINPQMPDSSPSNSLKISSKGMYSSIKHLIKSESYFCNLHDSICSNEK